MSNAPVQIERAEGLIFVNGPKGFFGVVDSDEKLKHLLEKHAFTPEQCETGARPMTFREALWPMFRAVVNRFTVALFAMMLVLLWLKGAFCAQVG